MLSVPVWLGREGAYYEFEYYILVPHQYRIILFGQAILVYMVFMMNSNTVLHIRVLRLLIILLEDKEIVICFSPFNQV